MERAILEVKEWVRANAVRDREGLRKCLDEGVFMLNFLKPKGVLGGRTPARAHLCLTGERSEPVRAALDFPGKDR